MKDRTAEDLAIVAVQNAQTWREDRPVSSDRAFDGSRLQWRSRDFPACFGRSTHSAKRTGIRTTRTAYDISRADRGRSYSDASEARGRIGDWGKA